MGGKTKHNQRTKNNVKPSSSSRSAELLGGSAPTFVGFQAHSELGLVPFAPGFSNSEHMPDTFDASISPQYQIIFRKMSKKDPLTKKKALQELIDLVNASDVSEVKFLLPLWPKFYHNLASDTEHNVRELTQTVLHLLVTKCKKAVAPYLKQLVPVWLASQFDNYAPAASIARNSFAETFVSTTDRTQEVCLHCQVEIMDYATRNLTFHTAATLSSGKGLTPVESEQKYQRVLVCTLKAVSFFLEHTAKATDQSEICAGLQKLMSHQKFWSYAKSKQPVVKAAWYELIYYVLQSPKLLEVVSPQRAQLITVSFHNIDESDPLVAPHVWGCILLLQSNFDDWHEIINFRTTVWPKFSSLLRRSFNRNAESICPNLLPFFSHLSQVAPLSEEYHELCKQFFDDMKSIIQTESVTSKSDYSIIVKTYFECLRYLLQKISNTSHISLEQADEVFALRLLKENVFEPITWFLNSGSTISTKYFFQHTSALVAFFDRQSSNSHLYSRLLDNFWEQIFTLITEDLTRKDIDELFLEHVIEFVNDLYVANPSLEEQRVQFAKDGEKGVNHTNTTEETCNKKISSSANVSTKAAFIQKELKQLVVRLLRICLHKTSELKSTKYIMHVQLLIKMFSDIDFLTSITDEGTVKATLQCFCDLTREMTLDRAASEVIINIIFDILEKLETSEKFAFIDTHLLKTSEPLVQTLVLQRLLSYPLCNESEVRTMLLGTAMSEIVIKIAHEVVSGHSKELFNLLHKCFFQTDTGEILIGPKTVDAILHIVSEPLATTDLNYSPSGVEACGSFIAQIMPVVCNNKNSSEEAQHEVFLRLFKFTMEHTVNEYISQDTIWEITTCWQDALSSGDIVVNEKLLQSCAKVVEECIEFENITSAAIDAMAEAIAKLIICSRENMSGDEDRAANLDLSLKTLLHSDKTTNSAAQDFEKICLFFESVKGQVSMSTDPVGSCRSLTTMKPFLRRCLLNLSTILKLVCKGKSTQNNSKNSDTNDDEVTDNYCDFTSDLLNNWSDLLLTELQTCINISAAGDALINLVNRLDETAETLAIGLSEKVKFLMRNGGEIVNVLKERLLEEAAKEWSVGSCRSLTYLVYSEQYAQFEENATILFAEDLSEYLIPRNALKAYLNCLQYLLPNLQPRSVTAQSPIMRAEPTDMWVKASILRCLIVNNFNCALNEKSDKDILTACLRFITETVEKQQAVQKNSLLYNVDVQGQPFIDVINTVEYVNLLIELIGKFPYELTIKNWDAIRIGLSSWVLSISKSIGSYTDMKTSLFVVRVFKLFAALTNFFKCEKQKSSTELLKNVTDEWENLFAREVNLVLFKTFYGLLKLEDVSSEFYDCYVCILDEITPAVELIDYSAVYGFCKSSTKITLDDLNNFLLKYLSSSIHSVRTCCLHIVRQLVPYFVAEDIETYDKKSEQFEKDEMNAIKWHYLNRFEDYIARYDLPIRKYLSEFSFKLTEIADLEPIDRNEAFSYLMLWDCIIYCCAHSPVAVRSVYTNWLHDNKYEENLLHFLFRAMPVEILKNHSAKQMNNDIFKGLSWQQIKDENLSLEKYVCHLYTDVLRKLPAVVRKWWNTSPSRQKTFIDTLTTNFVSPIICHEELRGIGNKKEKHENMQVTVHTSSREVLAVYSIDEARMELVITLAPNHPLGAVKVECGKQIGGRSSARNVGMQLTIFLTHQNGTIIDGLTMWKNNLDKKFEGVEECYVCYTVIHQDTCQLPKLTCKTCKKKFHGPCLYKWFTTSSKSTCPICRNVF